MAARATNGTTRRRFLRGVGTGLVAATAAGAAGRAAREARAAAPADRDAAPTPAPASTAPEPRRPPNLLFLLTDDQRWDTLGCMGNPLIRTPHLDRLAAGGVVFENMFVTTSICMSSRASIFTGLYTRTHGIDSFSKPLTDALFALSYPERLRAAGYRTGFVGKYGVGPVPKDRFDFNTGFPGQGHYFPQSEAARMKAAEAGPLSGPHQNALMADQAVEFLGGCAADRPFCLSVSFKSPHCQDGDPRQFLFEPDLADLYREAAIPVPETADPRDFERFPDFVRASEARRRWQVRFSTPEKHQEMVKAYYRLITGVDRAVGRMVETLEARGLAGNTAIVFTGDNGFYLGEHGLAGKWLMHEPSIRVPLVVYDPRLPAEARGRRVREMALNVDVAPTLLDWAGLEVPAAMQGRSLVPLVEGRRVPWRSEWFYEHTMLDRVLPPSEGVRDQRWKYIRYFKGDPPFEELYDLEADPHEKANLAADAGHARRLEAMRERWQVWRRTLDAWRLDDPPRDRAML